MEGEMTDQEKNIEVAELCGLKVKRIEEHIVEIESDSPLPDYCNDLNACHEMALTLSDVVFTNTDGFNWTDKSQFGVELERLMFAQDNNTTNFDIYNATAPKRVEAFLRVKGKIV
jgi:hypothetical protein